MKTPAQDAALEALQDSRNGDDDVEQARQQHLFCLIESMARMPAGNNPQCLTATLLYARQALCQYLRNNNACALEQVANGYLLCSYVGLAA